MQDNSIQKTAVALGFFDGLHLAHIQVLENALKKNGKMRPAVLLFSEHPQRVLRGISVPGLLQTQKRDEILLGLGFEIHTLPFSDIKDETPEEFFEKIITARLNAGFISCGYNYRFGKNGAGDTAVLDKLCKKNGIELCVCPKVTLNGEAVSSTAIRNAVAIGDIQKANAMLGRPFSFSAPVFDGDHRGRTLGAPTVNQYLPENFAVPAFGVYVSAVKINGRLYRGVTNIGNRPTFDGESVRSETFIMDFSGNLYGQNIETRLYSFIRKERRFESVEALKAQIQRDAGTAAAFEVPDFLTE